MKAHLGSLLYSLCLHGWCVYCDIDTIGEQSVFVQTEYVEQQRRSMPKKPTVATAATPARASAATAKSATVAKKATPAAATSKPAAPAVVDSDEMLARQQRALAVERAKQQTNRRARLIGRIAREV
jgi:hypothetical protein